MKYKKYYILLAFILLFIVFVFTSGEARVTGICSNCHTMHNRQNGTAMATYGATGQPWKGTGPFQLLVRGDCLGCHGMGTANKIVTIGGSEIPQVYHTDPSGDLAGGNFAYILGTKGSGASDGKGHNVKDLGESDDVLDTAPGVISVTGHDMIITDQYLTCAGFIGCHGSRYDDTHHTSGITMIKGAHHNNVDGKCDVDPATATAANSYRFLVGVKGLENTVDKWQNKDKNSHNEYFGATAPLELGCSATVCHGSTGGIYSPNGSISVFCGTCHGDFHNQSEIGGSSSPFKRHPTDVILPNSDEYSAYTTYSVEAPVARQPNVPDSISPTVTPGSDVVMCLSCHAAHGTDYPDILRWDRSRMVVAGGGSGGCFTCHTEKAAP